MVFQQGFPFYARGAAAFFGGQRLSPTHIEHGGIMNALDLMIAIVGVLAVIAGWIMAGTYDEMQKGEDEQ